MEDLWGSTFDFVDDCERVIRMARRLGAHSVARVVRWLQHPESLERYGFERLHLKADAVAQRYLHRLEREAWL